MGAKNHINFQSDRPESGGADHDQGRAKSGFVERDKERFAEKQAEKREEALKEEDRQQEEP